MRPPFLGHPPQSRLDGPDGTDRTERTGRKLPPHPTGTLDEVAPATCSPVVVIPSATRLVVLAVPAEAAAAVLISALAPVPVLACGTLLAEPVSGVRTAGPLVPARRTITTAFSPTTVAAGASETSPTTVTVTVTATVAATATRPVALLEPIPGVRAALFTLAKIVPETAALILPLPLAKVLLALAPRGQRVRGGIVTKLP